MIILYDDQTIESVKICKRHRSESETDDDFLVAFIRLAPHFDVVECFFSDHRLGDKEFVVFCGPKDFLERALEKLHSMARLYR